MFAALAPIALARLLATYPQPARNVLAPRANRRIREPPTDAEIQGGLRARTVSDPRAAVISPSWLQRPTSTPTGVLIATCQPVGGD